MSLSYVYDFDQHTASARKDFQDKIVGANELMNVLEPALQRIQRRLLGSKQLQYTTCTQTAKSLRYLLAMAGEWCAFRDKFLDCHAAIIKVFQKFDDLSCLLSVDKLNDQRYGNKLSMAYKKFGQLHLPTHPQLKQIETVQGRWRKIHADAFELYQQYFTDLNNLPPWKEIKPVCPGGGRAAYSALMAVKESHIHTRHKPWQNELFGWMNNYPTVHKATVRVARHICGRRFEAAGPAPSFASGCKLLQDGRDYKSGLLYEWTPQSNNDRLANVAWKHHALIDKLKLAGGYSGHCSARLLNYLRRQADHGKIKIWHAIANKIMGLLEDGRSANATLTFITGPIERAHGDDYYAPVMWSEDAGRSQYRTPGGWPQTYYGYILMRRGWPDMIHISNNDVIPLTPETISQRLDVASSGYFNQLRDERLKHLSTRQRQIRLLLDMRSLKYVQFTREDSYAVQNCKPGTEEFIQHLGLLKKEDAAQAVTGRQLAKAWYKHKFYQEMRLRSVVNHLLNKQEIYLRTAFESVTALFPPEYEPASPVPPAETSVEFPVVADRRALLIASQFPVETDTAHSLLIQQPGFIYPNEVVDMTHNRPTFHWPQNQEANSIVPAS